MSVQTDTQDKWGSRRSFLGAMFSQMLGTNTVILLPQQGILHGATGHVIMYTAMYVLIGIPLLYMEYVIGQFTGRNCIEVWRARPFLAHVAYVQIFWQIMNVITNHTFACFAVHYFMVSFESPIPYYQCGPWSYDNCNILEFNYTIHQDCLSVNERLPYCTQLCTTFPEFQYWRYFTLGLNRNYFYLAWRVTLASAFICIVCFFSCFKQIKSMKKMLGFFVIFIIISRILMLIGSMLQKGVVVKFDGAVDIDFSKFSQNVQVSKSLLSMMSSLNLGTGISFNLASTSSVRSPCYSNTVIVVVVTAGITAVGICNLAMMLCPYSFKYNISPHVVAQYPMFIVYETLPRLLNVYEYKAFWLILTYSMTAMSFFCVNVIIIANLIDITSKKYPVVSSYPGITSAAAMVVLFLVTIPLLGNKSLLFIADVYRGINFFPMFTVVIECFVFMIAYGLERFSEDVHFMLGVQPNAFVKISWVLSVFGCIFVLVNELISTYGGKHLSVGTHTGFWVMTIVMSTTLLVAVVQVLKALYHKRLNEVIALDPSWGPRSQLLQRSRAMFTTHAMTKECIYRQYHLQSGIVARQRSCNIRAPNL